MIRDNIKLIVLWYINKIFVLVGFLCCYLVWCFGVKVNCSKIIYRLVVIVFICLI